MTHSHDITRGNLLAKLLGHGSLYFISSLTTKFAGFLLLPVYTRLFDTAQYGIIDTLSSVSLLLVTFFSLYLDSAYARYYFDYKDDPAAVRRYTSTVIWFVCGWGSLLLLISLAAFYPIMPRLLGYPYMPVVPLAFLAQLIVQAGNFARVHMRVGHRSWMVVTMDLIQFFVNVGLVLLFVWRWGWGIEGKFWAQLVSVALFSVMGFYYLWKFKLIAFEFDRTMLWESLAFSIPLMPNLIGGWINGLADRVILMAAIGASETGVFSIARQISQGYYVFIMAFSFVYSPMIFAMMKKSESEGMRRLENYVPNYWIVMMFLAFAMAVFSREIVLLMTESNFHGAYLILPVLILGQLCGAFYQPIAPLLSYRKRTFIISSGAIIQGSLNLAINLALIPRYGMKAAAWSAFLATLVYFLWLFAWSQRDFRIQLPWGRLVRAAIVLSLCWCLIYVIPEVKLGFGIAVKTGIVMFAALLIIVGRCLGPEVKTEIVQFLQSITAKLSNKAE